MNKQQEPRLRFQGFTGEWKTEGFESVGEFNPKAEIPQIFQYVDLESVVGTQLISYREEFKETAPSRAQRLAKNGDLFFQAVRPYQKNNYLFEKNNENFVFSTGYIQIRPQNDGYFLLTLVQKEEFVQEVLLRCTGTSYPAINTSSLQNIAILLPPTAEEQAHLGNFFRRLDSQIAESRTVLEKSRQLKKAMLAKMFPANGEKIPEIRFKGFDGEWEYRKLGEVASSYSGGTPSVGNSKFYGGNIPFIRSGEIHSSKTELFLTQEGLENSSAKLVKQGDILYALYGATSGEVERSKINGAINQAILAIIPNENYDAEFISQWLKNNKENIVNLYLQGGQGNLSGEIVKKIEISFPTKKEQTAIGNFFRQLDETIALQTAEVEKLNQLKKGLLAAMLV
ncbi:restriction endonuclease subunit S [Neisseria subflava]|uniref:Restriction endonuclease subunit S n=1 Tax=Neisseria subflava TaxID=28449 RepID=A0A9X9N3Z0_NEISU|nr:restriction endonuclease subunit S [Neisseria subflava]UTG72574.1 restriction endonuclease subunit S [Neisseria subflava]